MHTSYGVDNMVGTLRRVAVKRPREAWGSQERISASWQVLGYLDEPDFAAATEEHREFVRILVDAGVEVLYLLEDDRAGPDSLYVHDPGAVTSQGALLFTPGKPCREGEGEALSSFFGDCEIPIAETFAGQAHIEGGDLLWLDQHTLLVGRGHRTNGAGVERLRAHFRPAGVEVIEIHLPYAEGPGDILHLQSMISLLDRDLALVWPRFLAVCVLEMLEERGIRWIEAAEEEVPHQAANVLALAPRRVVAVEGCVETLARMRAEGVEVEVFAGEEIAVKGCGGPTCLTLPILRS